MAIATLTSKGQLTVPKPIRESLRLHAGDKVEIVARDGEAVMRLVTVHVDDVIGMLHRYARRSHTIKELDDGIRKAVAGRHA